jgi:hypothetical protein
LNGARLRTLFVMYSFLSGRSIRRARMTLIKTKTLHAIERLTQLFTISTRLVFYMPFTICMLAKTTISQSSVCRYLFGDKRLEDRARKD